MVGLLWRGLFGLSGLFGLHETDLSDQIDKTDLFNQTDHKRIGETSSWKV